MARQGLIHFYAACSCGAVCNARNAQGWAHQHVNRYGEGHLVELQLGYTVSGPAINPPKRGPHARP